jgi:hypothetical protein
MPGDAYDTSKRFQEIADDRTLTHDRDDMNG